MSIRETILELRSLYGLSVPRIARILLVDVSTVYGWKNGGRYGVESEIKVDMLRDALRENRKIIILSDWEIRELVFSREKILPVPENKKSPGRPRQNPFVLVTTSELDAMPMGTEYWRLWMPNHKYHQYSIRFDNGLEDAEGLIVRKCVKGGGAKDIYRVENADFQLVEMENEK